MPLARTSISIDQSVLDRFYRAYPAGQRSQAIQRLMERDLADNIDALTLAAQTVETHPDFQTAREDAALWEAAAGRDGLEEPDA